MNLQLNQNLGNWLTELNRKTVDKIYQIDYNNDRHEDDYLPFLFFMTFKDLEMFLEIQGDFDGVHIRIYLNDISQLGQKLKDNDFPNEPDLWKVYDTKADETLGKLLGQKIEYIEYGIDKDEFEIIGTICKGEKDVFNFIRLVSDKISLTIMEGGLGLGVSDDPKKKLNFEEVFDKYDTK
jgi:hypothetical protein